MRGTQKPHIPTVLSGPLIAKAAETDLDHLHHRQHRYNMSGITPAAAPPIVVPTDLEHGTQRKRSLEHVETAEIDEKMGRDVQRIELSHADVSGVCSHTA